MVGFNHPARAFAFLVCLTSPNQIAAGAPQTTVTDARVPLQHAVNQRLMQFLFILPFGSFVHGFGVGLGLGEGDGLGLGVGEGDGAGVGLGDGEGLGDGKGVGVGVGEGLATGVGVGVGLGTTAAPLCAALSASMSAPTPIIGLRHSAGNGSESG